MAESIYHLLRFLLKLLSYIPFRLLYIVSDGMFYILYYIIRYRRAVVRKNLTESFPDKSLHEIKLIEKKFYRFFMDMTIESCKLASMSQDAIRRRMAFKNVEAVNSLLRSGKSVAVYLGHYGNWEWVSSMPLWLDENAIGAQIYHKLRNDSTNRLMLHIRERMGAVSVDMHKTARYITTLAAEHKVCTIGFIADQSPRMRESRHFLRFLNHNTPVLTGTEKIIKHYGFEAFYLDVRRTRRGFYTAEFVRMHDEPRSLPDFELTALYFKHLEQAITRQPELYLWTHNRFKHATKLD
jgi:KDO2-lipid IV(A) lauroyltransferase